MITREQTLAELRALMAPMFELDPAAIVVEARLVDDLDLDSIDTIDLAMRMQEIVGGRIDESRLRKVRTVGDVIDVVLEMRGAA